MATLQPIIIWLNAVLIALTMPALCARVGRRVFVVGVFGGHDALITFAAICATTFSIFQVVCTSLGYGLHQEVVDPSNMPKLRKLILASNVFYFLCNWAVKHALLLFYSEIVREKKFRGSIWFMHFVAFGFGASSVLVNIFQCRPINKAWYPEMAGYCVNVDLFLNFNAPIMLITDLVLYIMPVVFTWHLQLRRPQRIGLNCLFALGGLVLAASAARVHAVHRLGLSPDFTWWFAYAMIWSVLENHLAVVVACAPSVKVIALLVFPRLASSLGKVVSIITPSNSRSRSRASGRSYDASDLESGTRQSDKLKPTPLTTPLPSPAFTAASGKSGASRASRNFAKWFKGPTSPRDLTNDSMDRSLVYVEELQSPKGVHLTSMQKEILGPDGLDNGSRTMTPNAETDIRVQHTITVEDASVRGSSENGSAGIRLVGRAV